VTTEFIYVDAPVAAQDGSPDQAAPAAEVSDDDSNAANDTGQSLDDVDGEHEDGEHEDGEHDDGEHEDDHEDEDDGEHEDEDDD
jgi:hypothetical protein